MIVLFKDLKITLIFPDQHQYLKIMDSVPGHSEWTKTVTVPQASSSDISDWPH